MPLALPWLVISTFITCSSPPSLPVCHNTSLHFNLITFLLFHLFSWPANNFFFNSQVWLLAGARTRPSLHPFSTKNIYVHMAKKARKEIWKQISKWAMRQELEKESEKAQSAEGRRESEVGSGRNGVLLSPTARRDKLSGAFLCVCVCVCKDKHWKKLYRVARNLSRFKRNKTQKSLLLHTLVCVQASLEESSYSL